MPKKAARSARPSKIRPLKRAGVRHPAPWLLRLYVAGQTSNSLAAFSNLKRLCDEHLSGHYRIEVIDLVQAPQRAVDDQIVALPTLVRKLPEPVKRVIGDLSDVERVLVGMDVRRAKKPAPPQSLR